MTHTTFGSIVDELQEAKLKGGFEIDSKSPFKFDIIFRNIRWWDISELKKVRHLKKIIEQRRMAGYEFSYFIQYKRNYTRTAFEFCLGCTNLFFACFRSIEMVEANEAPHWFALCWDITFACIFFGWAFTKILFKNEKRNTISY